jgi:bifunctional glutamyl/prolyl-tRNA synthetase
MFDISFEDPETKEKQFAYQNSWAITTRSIGVLVMVHGDDKGLVLPPRIAKYQVVLVPCGITASLSDADRKQLYASCEQVCDSLRAAGVRVKEDFRDNYSPGWKFNHWELKGVPLRIELGPKDLKAGQLVTVRRDNGEKQTIPLTEAASAVPALLETIQAAMLDRARKELKDNTVHANDFDTFCAGLDRKAVIMAPFCGEIPCEEKIKQDSARDAVVEEGAPAMGAKGLCIPFKQPRELTESDKCVCPGCPNKPKFITLFGRSY